VSAKIIQWTDHLGRLWYSDDEKKREHARHAKQFVYNQEVIRKVNRRKRTKVGES
jgi:hypothetical protein